MLNFSSECTATKGLSMNVRDLMQFPLHVVVKKSLHMIRAVLSCKVGV